MHIYSAIGPELSNKKATLCGALAIFPLCVPFPIWMPQVGAEKLGIIQC